MAVYSPFDINEIMRRLAAADLRLVASLAARMGLSVSEVSALEHLNAAGDLTAGQLAHRLHMTSGAITGLADRLERIGHVRRLPNPRDHRSLLLRSTEQADEQVLRQIMPLASEAHEYIATLSEEEREVVGEFLERMIALIEKHAQVDAGREV